MRNLKLGVLSVFAAAAVLILGGRWLGEAAAGIGSAASLAAPTGVTASDNQYANKVGIIWAAARDATVYRIFRNTTNDPATAADVGTTPANYFFDTTAVTGQVYFYWVRAESSQTTSAFSTPDQGVRASGSIVPSAFPPLEPPPAPAGNPVTAAKANLGKSLFWDEQLSATKTVSCGTCHRSSEGGADPRTSAADVRTRNPGFDNTFGTPDDVLGSPGVPRNNADGTYAVSPLFGFSEQVTNRKSPSYLNAGYAVNGLFWDGRAAPIFRDPITNAIVLASGASLESQVLGPPTSPVEMGHNTRNWNDVAARVAASKPLAIAVNIPPSLSDWIGGRTYPELFQEAFGTPDVTPSRIAMAIATHERTLFSDQTPLDRSSAQIEPLTPQEEAGKTLFVTLQCNTCHDGSLLTDQQFRNIGVRPQAEDRGRGAVTGNPDDDAAFKTPTLRNVELHAPYMHNGRFATLEEVIDFYDRGGDFDAPNIDRGVIRPLNLTAEEKAQLVAFLKRPLTDPRVAKELPPFDRPTLYTESNRVPVVSGTGRAGTGGIVPNAVAIEPPLLGNPSFTVAVARGLGNASAILVIDSADPGVGASIPAAGSFARVATTLLGTKSGGYGSVNLSIPNNPALVGRTFYGRWYVTDSAAANGFAVSRLFQFTIFAGNGTTLTRRAPFDFDGDGKTDIGIYRASAGEWWYRRSSDGQVPAAQFGSSADKIAPVDFTGDGKADLAFWRPSTGEWFVLRSEDGAYFAFPFGTAGDIPAPADYDGDGRSDAAVFRPSTSTWFILQSGGGGVRIERFGAAGDVPVAADYDGDGKADIAIYRPAARQWWINRSAAGLQAIQFGSSADKPVQSDYTGDGKADIAVWRPSTGQWFIVRSEDTAFYAFPFGATGDVPAAGDYDGDGRSDAAVFRPSTSTWFILGTTSGTQITQFGIPDDRPVANAFVP